MLLIISKLLTSGNVLCQGGQTRYFAWAKWVGSFLVEPFSG